MADLIEALIAHDPPRNVVGEAPFLVPGDLSTPNEAYFARCDRIIERAARLGMLLLLEPCYLGYRDPHWTSSGTTRRAGTARSWPTAWRPATASVATLARATHRRANILWVMSGDRDPGEAREHVDAMAEGIREAAPGHGLFTAHVHPGHRPVEEFAGSSWLTVNATYSYEIVHRDLLEEHRRPEPRSRTSSSSPATSTCTTRRHSRSAARPGGR